MRRRDPRSAGTVGLLTAWENAKPVIGGLLGAPTEDEGRQMGLLDEAFLAANAAGDRRGMAEAIGQQAALYGPNMLGAGVIKAYHGSPHSFDKFRMDRIGTGEGAQAYGHGLYFAENEGVAKSYKDTLSGSQIRMTDGTNVPYGAMSERLEAAARSATKLHPDQARQIAKNVLDDNLTIADVDGMGGPFEDAYKAAINELAGGKQSPGSMYEVNINANPDDFLDWDKPFSSADDVERFAARFDGVDPALRKKIEDYGYMRQQAGQPMPDGNDIIREVFGGVGEKASQQATQTMSEAGIPGIRYRDAGSRGLDGREGTRNYVVFDENLISIVKKYGIAGAVSAGLLTNEQAQAFVDQQSDQEAVKP